MPGILLLGLDPSNKALLKDQLISRMSLKFKGFNVAAIRWGELCSHDHLLLGRLCGYPSDSSTSHIAKGRGSPPEVCKDMKCVTLKKDMSPIPPEDSF